METPRIRQLRERVEQLQSRVDHVYDGFELDRNRAEQYSSNYDRIQREIHVNWRKMHYYPKIKRALPAVAFGSLTLCMGSFGALSATLGGHPAVTAAVLGLGTLGALGVAGSVWANEKLKPQMAGLERRYYDSLEELERLPRVINLFEKPQQELAALRPELEAARQELQQLEALSSEVLGVVKGALETTSARVVELEGAIQVAGVRLKKRPQGR